MLNAILLNVAAPKNQLTLIFLLTMELAVTNFSKYALQFLVLSMISSSAKK
jgi:hypothetical protein